uniref:Uncharacterized protein n=1 Tax=Caenorhabditis japonica TaxID=281687 RepID=A0A8R1HL91_CAEJA
MLQQTANNELYLQIHAQKLPSTQARQVVAQALIEMLQNWCMQLFWMTIFCVVNCCGDDTVEKKKPKRCVAGESKKKLEDIEQKMLRHLTSPLISGPLRPVKQSRRRISSRPPSAQLFDIAEEE